MKGKISRRLCSWLLVFAMLFCLLPTAAFAVEGNSLQAAVSHNLAPENGEYPEDSLPGTKNLDGIPTNGIKVPTEAGSFTPDIPFGGTYVVDGVTYQLDKIQLMTSGSDGLTYEYAKDLSGNSSVNIPEGAKTAAIFYYWKAIQDTTEPEEPDQPEGDVFNFIDSLTRKVNQGGTFVLRRPQYGMDIYKVESKENLTFTYDATMDMENLGSVIFGDGSWETLQVNVDKIQESTWVDLHFQFDKDWIQKEDIHIDENTTLTSDMFDFKKDDDGVFHEIKDMENGGVELVLHCKWKTPSQEDLNEGLDPMITLTGVKVDLPSNWNGNETIVIKNHGYVDGEVHAKLNPDATYVERADINGGTKDDMFVLTTSDKVSLPGLDKSIIVNDEEVDNTSVDAGGKVTFQLESNVPENLKDYIHYTQTGTGDPTDNNGEVDLKGEMEEYTLTFHDQIADELTIDFESFVVKLGDDTELTYMDEYTIEETEDGFNLTVDLAQLYAMGLINEEEDFGKTPITVEYQATLNQNVEHGTFENEAWVTDNHEWETEHDTVTVDTYQIKITKYETGHDNKHLAGAYFQLYSDPECTESIGEEQTTGEDGLAYFSGLAAGTYYLKETKAPEGYVCSTEVLEIEVPGDNADRDNVIGTRFANSLIPHTGGMGTTIFSIVGGVLIAMAGTVFVISRRKRRA